MHARRWSLFFLVTTGRGSTLPQITTEEAEELLQWTTRLGRSAGFVVAATEAPMVRRVILQQRGLGPDAAVPGAGMRDGNGILFLSYRGDVMPSGFLPITIGNVRDTDALTLYRDTPLMRDLRSPDKFGGRCGRCEWREVCGGSRGRAYAATGDPLSEDPLCLWEPQGL
jgi:radical SAM protein with 4Fe4S-binding SPASM domain